MKILVLSDIHSQVEKLAEIRQNIPTEVDTALILGDLTNYGDKHPKEIIDIIGLEKFYAIPGNLDDWRTLDELEELGVSIHGKKVRFGEVTLIGFGGGLEGHTGRILNNEEKIYTTLENILEGEVTTIASRKDGLVNPEGITVGSKGSIFVTDNGARAIFRIRDGKVEKVISFSDNYGDLQGIAIKDGNEIYVITSDGYGSQSFMPSFLIKITSIGGVEFE